MRKFIRANPSAPWHYAVRCSIGYVAACGGRCIAPNATEFEGHPPTGEVCKRCARLVTVPPDDNAGGAWW